MVKTVWRYDRVTEFFCEAVRVVELRLFSANLFFIFLVPDLQEFWQLQVQKTLSFG